MDPSSSQDSIGWLDREPEYWDLVSELLQLRQETADSVGRQQYVYQVLDEAVESGNSSTMQKARDEVYQIEDTLREQTIPVAGQTC